MRPWFLLALAACGGAAASVVAPPDPMADGTILERAPCAIPTDPDAFAAAVTAYYEADIRTAGLDAELEARPLASTFTVGENARLAAAAEEGRCERVVYASSGLRVVGYVVRPAASGPHPVILWLRGGNRDLGKIDALSLLNLAYLADRGFVVIGVQNRGADGGEGADEFGGADVDDVLAAVPLARALPDADADRIYVLGGSRGAMQGLLALRRGLPAKAAAWRGGLFDLHLTLERRPALGPLWAELMPDDEPDRGAALARRSAVRWADEVRTPQLVVHGRQDWRADVADAETFASLLDAAGIEHRLVIYEREEHQLALHRPEWLDEAIAWFRAHP